MAKTKISELDAAAANNTDINSVDVSEGCAPSGINNAIREMGAMLKRMDNGTDHLTNPNITGDLDVDNININGNTISSTDTNGNINITPNGTGAVAFTTNATFGDNDKAIFGAGSDLQIYHDGSNSYVRDNGTGVLTLQGTNQVKIQSPVTGENYAIFNDNGAVTLNYDNSLKFATNTNGVDVTGILTADGLTVDATSNNVIITGPAQTGLASSVVELKTGGTIGNRAGYAVTNSNGGLLIGMTGEVVGTGAYPSNTGKGYLWNSDSGLSYQSLGFEKNLLQFYIASSEKMRIDSSGNLLVGKTSAATNVEGGELRENGQVLAVATNVNPFFGARLGSDGDIAVFRKDSTTVGSIGANASRVYMAGPSRGIKFGNSSMNPVTASGQGADNSVDLGDSNIRFKDLYLSNRLKLSAGGGIEFGQATTSASGASASSTLLDSYEKGTFSPTLNLQSGNFSSTQTKNGNYVKIGDVVVCMCNINLSTHGGPTGTGVGWRVEGFPFTTMNIQGGAPSPIFNNNIADVCGFGRLENNSLTAMLFTSRVNGVATDANLFFTVIYLTA